MKPPTRKKLISKSKYRAIPTTIDNIRFGSRLEASRYAELKLLKKAGKIANLRTQVKFPLHVGETKIGDYVADFTYHEIVNDELECFVVEDTKSLPTMTPIYRWKRKHLLAEYGIKITEITKRTRR